MCALTALVAASASAFETRPFMVGVYSLSPGGEETVGEEPSTTLSVGVGEVFSLPARVEGGRSLADQILPMSDGVVGLSVEFTQDTSLGFSSYLGLGVGATAQSLEADGVDDARAAYELSFGLRAPVATGAEVDFGYRFADEPLSSGADAAGSDESSSRHDFMVGVRYSF
ncbi:MAG: hypothetical protein AAF684_07350 [Pseudomonadota bacterium]